MHTLVVNANIVTGDGKTILENRSIVIEEELIDSIRTNPCPLYDNASRIVDAAGGLVIPGLIDSHDHAVTTGPFPCDVALPGLPKDRVTWRLNKYLLEGVTTIVNQDGFSTMEEVAEARSLTPMLVQTLSLHMPIHLKRARVFSCGGLKEEHYRTTIEEMIKQGALGIGEVGALGIPAPKTGQTPDLSYSYGLFIPLMVQNETGYSITLEDGVALGSALFARPPDEKALSALTKKLGISAAKNKLKEFAECAVENAWLTIEANREAAAYAGKLGVPLDFHSSPQTKEQVIEFARELKELFRAGHSDFLYEPGEAIEVARAVKKAGGWTDIMCGNFFRSREAGTPPNRKNHITALALLEEGLVDILENDSATRYWGDSMLRVLEYYIDQRVIDLPQAIAMVTKNPTNAIPNIAPNRGEISKGKIADLVVLDRGSISQVNTVLIKGKVVVDEGRIIYTQPNT
ncbi:MAG: amidohydrolase family protein [Dehalococcoidales bacterium]|jgi:imidazolonepropionase-like amidohydrolase|nr:amidohydrolase family protein [Dehalococcoidales bacterium]